MKIRRGGHHIHNQLGQSGEYNSCQQKESVVTNSSRDKLNASGGDSHCNNSRCTSWGDYANSNGNYSRGWGDDSSNDINNSSACGVDNSSNSNNSVAWGGDSSTNITKSKTWGQGVSQNWGTKETSSNGWGRMNNNDAIDNLQRERDSVEKSYTIQLKVMQEKYEKLLKNAKIDLDEIQNNYTKTKSLAKKNEEQCFVLRNEKKALETKLNYVVKENDEIKKKLHTLRIT